MLLRRASSPALLARWQAWMPSDSDMYLDFMKMHLKPEAVAANQER